MPSPFNKLKMEISGGSHEKCLSLTLEGLPEGRRIDAGLLRKFLDRRKSGKYAFSTPRREEDEVMFTEGLTDGVITGKIKAEIPNNNTRPSDYGYSATPRPSHADYVAVKKYGAAPSGGGAFSGRMTAALCIAGGIAKQLLASHGIKVLAYISEIAGIGCSTYDNGVPEPSVIESCHDYAYPVTDKSKINSVDEKLRSIASEGDSAGGIIECIAYNLPVGLGGPMTEGLEGRLSLSLFAIPAAPSVESRLGSKTPPLKGSDANDPFAYENGKVVTLTNNSGGINGGISNGMPLTVRVSFRPTPSISKEQRTVNLEKGENDLIKVRGRHDVAFLPRAVAAVESAVSLVILDCMIENNLI